MTITPDEAEPRAEPLVQGRDATQVVVVNQPSAVLVATDLTEASDLALKRGRLHADVTRASLIVCHVVPDVFRHHPLAPRRDQDDAVLASDLAKRASDLVNAQVQRVLGDRAGEYRVAVETGSAADEIVRLAEQEGASLVLVGGRPELGRVAERVVRYTHASVLVARPGPATGKALVATDFWPGSLPAIEAGEELHRVGVEITLIHAMDVPSSVPPDLLSPLGSTWMTPTKGSMDELRALGMSTLGGLAKQHGFAHFEQVDGRAAEVLLSRAAAVEAEGIVLGSRGRSGLRRLLLGGVAERVVRGASCSVLVARHASLPRDAQGVAEPPKL